MLIHPVAAMSCFAVMFYLYGFSLGSEERKFFLYGLFFFVLGWIPEIINLMDSELQHALIYDSSPSMLVFSALFAIGFTTMFYVFGYLSGIYYQRHKLSQLKTIRGV